MNYNTAALTEVLDITDEKVTLLLKFVACSIHMVLKIYIMQNISTTNTA